MRKGWTSGHQGLPIETDFLCVCVCVCVCVCLSTLEHWQSIIEPKITKQIFETSYQRDGDVIKRNNKVVQRLDTKAKDTKDGVHIPQPNGTKAKDGGKHSSTTSHNSHHSGKPGRNARWCEKCNRWSQVCNRSANKVTGSKKSSCLVRTSTTNTRSTSSGLISWKNQSRFEKVELLYETEV